MVNICGKCGYFNEGYCDRLGISWRFNSPICDFYVKRRSERNGGVSKDTE